jgi:hypothetical protein
MNDQVDMSQFIAARSDQLNADDLMDNPRTITITKVTASPDSAEQPVSIHYQGGEGRPWKPCKTMRRILVGVWGKDASQYVGRSLTLYRDPSVAFGGMQVGGIRVSHMSHIEGEKTVALQVTRGRKAPFKVLPLKNAPAAPATGDDQATKWANAYTVKLETLATIEEVETFAGQKAAKLAELEEARPDLHSKVSAALGARKTALRPTSSFEDDDLSADAGPDDEEGEQRQPDPQTNDQVKTAAQEAVERVVAELAAAGDLKAVIAIEKANEGHRAFLPEHLIAVLDSAVDMAKKRLEKVGA